MMDSTKLASLKAELKLKLNITWEDDDTNSKLESILADAEIILNHKLGAEIDYSVPGIEHSLYLNYGMYAWNNCIDEFDERYRPEIYTARHIQEVNSYREEVLLDES